jgi:hypothetical protein
MVEQVSSHHGSQEGRKEGEGEGEKGKGRERASEPVLGGTSRGVAQLF